MRGQLVCVVTIFAALPGCLTLYSKTEYVRCDEQRRPVQFETPQAADEFAQAVKNCDGHVGGTYFGVPFITLFAKNQELSKNAIWNECVSKCDTNQDGLITCAEVTVFSKQH